MPNEPEGLAWLKDLITQGNQLNQEGLKQIAQALATRDDAFSKSFRELEKEVGKIGNKLDLAIQDVDRNKSILEPENKPSVQERLTVLEEKDRQHETKWNWAFGLISTGVTGVLALLANEAWKFLTTGRGAGK